MHSHRGRWERGARGNRGDLFGIGIEKVEMPNKIRMEDKTSFQSSSMGMHMGVGGLPKK